MGQFFYLTNQQSDCRLAEQKPQQEYSEKLETLKESYFPKTSSAKTETLTEGEAGAPESYTGSMAGYLKTLSAFQK